MKENIEGDKKIFGHTQKKGAGVRHQYKELSRDFDPQECAKKGKGAQEGIAYSQIIVIVWCKHGKGKRRLARLTMGEAETHDISL